MDKSERWTNRQLEHYKKAVEGRTDPPRYHKFRDEYLGHPPLKIVDCGCAGADITKELSERGYEVIGIDYPDIIEKTRKKYPDLIFYSCDLNDGIPIAIGDVDWVYASEILEHITHDFDFLMSCYDCLRIGGKLYITVPRKAEKWNGHLRYYPKESLENLLWAAGFNEITFDTTFASCIVIGEKV